MFGLISPTQSSVHLQMLLKPISQWLHKQSRWTPDTHPSSTTLQSIPTRKVYPTSQWLHKQISGTPDTYPPLFNLYPLGKCITNLRRWEQPVSLLAPLLSNNSELPLPAGGLNTTKPACQHKPTEPLGYSCTHKTSSPSVLVPGGADHKVKTKSMKGVAKLDISFTVKCGGLEF